MRGSWYKGESKTNLIKAIRINKRNNIIAGASHLLAYFLTTITLSVISVFKYSLFLTDGSQPGFLTIEKFGCFSTEYTDSRKNIQPAMESIENSNCWLLSNTSLQRREAFERCAWCCWKLGHKYFALDGDNGCSAGMLLLVIQ